MSTCLENDQGYFGRRLQCSEPRTGWMDYEEDHSTREGGHRNKDVLGRGVATAQGVFECEASFDLGYLNKVDNGIG